MPHLTKPIFVAALSSTAAQATTPAKRAQPISDFVQVICSLAFGGSSWVQWWRTSRGRATRTLPFSVGGLQ